MNSLSMMQLSVGQYGMDRDRACVGLSSSFIVDLFLLFSLLCSLYVCCLLGM